MKKLVIFDLDGTLINTIADLAGATNYALKACGYPLHDTDAYRFFVGNGTSYSNAPCPKANGTKKTSGRYARSSYLIIICTTPT